MSVVHPVGSQVGPDAGRYRECKDGVLQVTNLKCSIPVDEPGDTWCRHHSASFTWGTRAGSEGSYSSVLVLPVELTKYQNPVTRTGVRYANLYAGCIR